MRRTIIVDFDGTLVDIRPIQDLVGDWDEFHQRSFSCPPNIKIVEFVERMDWFYDIVICTGKGEAYSNEMVEWLLRHEIPADTVLMRPKDNYMSDAELKPWLMENKFGEAWRDRVEFALEDRDKMVDAWRSLGITCFQCARSLY